MFVIEIDGKNFSRICFEACDVDAIANLLRTVFEHGIDIDCVKITKEESEDK